MESTTTKATAETPANAEGDARRIEALTGFLGRFAPAIGERRAEGFAEDVDDVTPAAIVEARDAAVLAAFRAVRRIANDGA